MLQVALLAVGCAAMLGRPFGLPRWVGPVVAALLGVVTTAIDVDDAWDALVDLAPALLFLVFAVPLAVALDELGFFAALAERVDGGRHLVVQLWVLATLVVIVFNLDAAVVLLTPLYARVALRNQMSPELLVFQPALLAGLASGLLPVSNLTNLIVASQFDLGVEDFVSVMVIPTALACTIGFVAYRWTFRAVPGPPTGGATVTRGDGRGVERGVDRALVRGAPIVVFVLVGFTVGELIGVPPWVVAAAAALWAAAHARRLPVETVPIEAVAIVAGLAVLVVAAVPHLPIEWFFERNGFVGGLLVGGFGVLSSDLVNNVPAVLAGASAVTSTEQVWPLLIGVNIGPLFVLTGALSGLLWRDTARRVGVEVSARRYSAVGVRVGLPALVVALPVAVLIAG
ncbi:MAG: SLC13 family permease [Actinomycetota bacterium]